MKTIDTVKELQDLVSKIDTTNIAIELSAGISPENDKHQPSPGCNKLAYLEKHLYKDDKILITRYSISLGLQEEIVHQAVHNFLGTRIAEIK